MDRRKFLIGLGALGVAGALALPSYLHDQPMKKPKVREGLVLCDIHAHPSNQRPLEDKVKLLSSPGLLGLSQRFNTGTILTYEEAVTLPGVEEITPGQLARMGEGYFLRTQEVVGGRYHFHAIGWEGDYLPHFDKPMDAVKAIKDAGGIVGFNHPFSIARVAGIFTLPFPWEDDLVKEVYDLCSEVDFVEVHNAHNINLAPYPLSMNKSNEMAWKMAETQCHGRADEMKGITVSSDCHELYEQAKLVGFYVEEKALTSMAAFMKTLINGDYFVFRNNAYLSRSSFLEGISGSRGGSLLEL